MLARNVFSKVRSGPSSAEIRLSLACLESTLLIVTSQGCGKSTRTLSILNDLLKNFHGIIFLLSQILESCRFIFLCAQWIAFVAIHGYLEVSL
jgi:ABC-type proline/glycine betaine transport system ATPase subunit